ncbi:MAG: TetR/AcrR family transcriptional regulator [Hyphomonadaceae bacterium]|nr:TetR/AcrR family transcriptional regulator [Hyphomonadaceae bacterium]
MTDLASRDRGSKFAERRNEVLRTAARVFSERGFRQATLDDVARALNVTRPALYHYARSKDELLHEAGLIAQHDLDLAVEEALRAPSGRERLRIFFRRYAELVCDDFGRCFVLVDHTEMAPDEAKRSRAFQAKLGKAVVSFIQSGNRDGSLPVARAGDLSRMLFAAINGVPRWRSQSGRSAAEIADSFLDMIEPARAD